MARIRSIKPEYWGDFDTATSLSRDARLLYIALWNFADEHARMAGDPRFVKGHCFPYDDDLTPGAIDALLGELAAAEKVVRYVDDAGAPHLFLPRLAKHQRLEAGKVPSRLPAPPDPDGPGSGAHESAQDPDSAPVDNPAVADPAASPQVNGTSPSRADKSARDAHKSGTNVVQQVAGGREQVAGGRQQNANTPPPVDNLPGEIEILRSKLDARKLAVRWDKLTPEQVDEIVALVHTHGDGPLVKAAIAAFQPNDPIVFAQGWLSHWRTIRKPGDLSLVEPTCSVHSFQREPASSCRLCAAERLEVVGR